MAFFVKNISAGIVTIADMGITIAPGDTYNLTQESRNDVAESTDLPNRISPGEIVALDPLDNITQLNTVNSLLAVTNIVKAHEEKYNLKYIIRATDKDYLKGKPLKPLPMLILVY